MRIEALARAIEARLLVPGGRTDADIVRVYGANTMSDLIANASPDTLLVTELSTTQLIRIAELMDVPGICLVNGSLPDRALADRARASGTAILASAGSVEETLRRLSGVLSGAGARPA